MKIVGIDSSGLVASVALLVDDVLVGEYTINNKKTHSQTLLPMLETMLNMAEVKISEIDAIAVAAGPGSFTGLRIGAATAKGLAGTLDIPIIPVPTLEGLAANFMNCDQVICPLMDARRKQAYYGIFQWEKGMLKQISPQAAEPIIDIVEKVNELGMPVLFLGDGVPVFKDYIEENVTVDVSYANPHDNCQRAGSIATLGKMYFENEKTVAARDFAPMYLRLSQAERERMEKISSSKQ